jgi:hypothetical protein
MNTIVALDNSIHYKIYQKQQQNKNGQLLKLVRGLVRTTFILATSIPKHWIFKQAIVSIFYGCKYCMYLFPKM